MIGDAMSRQVGGESVGKDGSSGFWILALSGAFGLHLSSPFPPLLFCARSASVQHPTP